MFKKLMLIGFKSFERALIPLGPLTLLVGANASGKSNVRDALRFLHGCAQGFTLTEVMDEKWGPGGFLLWRGIRGGAREIAWSGEDRFHLEIEIETSPGKYHRQLISVGFREDPRVPEVTDEALWQGDRTLFETSDFRLGRARTIFPNEKHRIRTYSAGRSIVSQVAGDEEADKRPRDSARIFVEMLKGARFLDLAPDAMREPTAPGQEVLGDRGENLSAVLLHIISNEAKKEALLGWLNLLTPLDVVDLRFHEDLLGRVLVYLVESNGREISAQSASDGTLRFLALTAALLSSESGRLFFIEEIDNGLHPTRLHLLLDVIEQATRSLGCQVIATTHNPQLLAYLSNEAREDAILLYRREHENASQAMRIMDLPDIRRVLSSQDLGRLFATGWFEDTVEFTATPELEPAAPAKERR